MSQISTAVAGSLPIDLASRATIAVIAIVLGSILLVGAGFAEADLLHNAAHDSRHAFAFPCH